MTNRILTHLEQLSSLFIPVDNMGGWTRKSSLQQMENHMQDGGLLIFFSAGEVSHIMRKGICNKSWHAGLIKQASKFRPPLLPMWIEVLNSALIYASATAHCRLKSVSIFPGTVGQIQCATT